MIDLAPCRACHGTGQHDGPMTDEEQKQRDRELRAAKRRGQSAPPLSKPCGACDGAGYVKPIRAGYVQMYEGMD